MDLRFVVLWIYLYTISRKKHYGNRDHRIQTEVTTCVTAQFMPEWIPIRFVMISAEKHLTEVITYQRLLYVDCCTLIFHPE